jgi:hypothetical protein
MMKFVCGKVPENSDFDPAAEGWTAVREPSVWMYQIIAVPIGFSVAFLLWIFWSTFTSDIFDDELFLSSIIWLLYVAVIIVHELIHALFHPGYGITANTYFGFWPSKLIFYAHYHSTLSKRRFMTVLIAPFIFISVVPLVLCAFSQYNSSVLCIISLFNTLCASVDIFGFMLIYFSVPAGSVVQNKGWKTYYKAD